MLTFGLQALLVNVFAMMTISIWEANCLNF